MSLSWTMADQHALNVKLLQVDKLNRSLHEMAELREQIRDEYLRLVADMLGMPKAKILDGPWSCGGSPTQQCLFEVKADTEAEGCLICGQPLMR